MADAPSASESTTPSALPPRLEEHAPTVSSPLNPNLVPSADALKDKLAKPRPMPREQREKKDSLKKRENNAQTRGNTPDVKSKKDNGPPAPSPMRYSIPEPRLPDFEPPKDYAFASHEPSPLFAPDGETELKKRLDHAENRKAFRYTYCIADPLFRHKQYYRQTDAEPYGPRMSFEDSDKWFHFDDGGKILTNEKGWRMGRANVVAREGSHYFEVKILRGVPAEGPIIPAGSEGKPLPHIRIGWARREAPLDAPVGFDGYSYGITDSRFETVHRSRPAKFVKPAGREKKAAAGKGAKKGSVEKTAAPEATVEEPIREGDVIGLQIQLPALSLHHKVVAGDYNPAVDFGDGFDADMDPSANKVLDIIRDRIPVRFKGNMIFEQSEYQSTKGMDSYNDRGLTNKVSPFPNHDDPTLRSLPHSAIRVWKNGKLMGTAFERLMAFLPPASEPSKAQGARLGFDDGMLGYYPAVSAFHGGVAEVNFGPDFWFPPVELVKEGEDYTARSTGTALRKLRSIGERFKEQIAEDVVWDIVDEVDFFVQDGAFDGEAGSANTEMGKVATTARGIASLEQGEY